MSQPKLTDEELKKLLDLAERPLQPGEEPLVDDVEAWVVAKGIKEGSTIIAPYQLYWEYLKWSKDPVKKRIFFCKFKKMFRMYNSVSVSYTRHYKLNPEPFDLSVESYFAMRRAIKDRKRDLLKYGRYYGKKIK